MKNEKNNVIAFRPRAERTIAKNVAHDDNEPFEDIMSRVDWDAKKATVKALYQAKTRELDMELKGRLDAAHVASKELKEALGRTSDTDAFAKDVSSKIAEEISPKITNYLMARMEASMKTDVGGPLIKDMTNRTIKSGQEMKADLKKDIREVAYKFLTIGYALIILGIVTFYFFVSL
jgi:hypothetical protein